MDSRLARSNDLLRELEAELDTARDVGESWEVATAESDWGWDTSAPRRIQRTNFRVRGCYDFFW